MPLTRQHRAVWIAVAILAAAGAGLRADELDQLTVGLQADGRIVVPTNQILKPAGKQITFPGRPVDLAWADEGKTLVVKNMRNLLFIDMATERIRQTLASPVGFSVVGLVVQGDRVYVSDAQNHVRVALRKPDGVYDWEKEIALDPPSVGKAAHPAGMALQNDTELWVTSTRGNNVQLIDLTTGKVKQVVPVGVAPYGVVVVPIASKEDRVYVSNWGGDPPQAGEPQLKTSDTPVRVDPRTNVANDGTLSVLGRDNGQWKLLKSIRVGLHPSGMARGRFTDILYVANANSDTITAIRTGNDRVVETILCAPEARLPFGSGVNALAFHHTAKANFAFVANGTNNCVAVVKLGDLHAAAAGPGTDSLRSKVAGLIPTGWYPGAVLVTPDGKKLCVANVKGHGSLSFQKPTEKEPRPPEKGRNSHDHLGSISIIDIPDEATLKRYTEEVNRNNRLAYSLAGLEKPRPDAKPVPVPERHGEPSVFEHVIYVIKENRTYDQVLGDMKEGNGDPSLVMFGEDVTPNHHALAREFTLFDNFYCSGVLSADGHSWVNEAYVTDYLEKAFGGFTRSYPYEGSDPLAFAPSGFLWDNALARRKTFRNYGEFCKTTYARGATWSDYYREFRNGRGLLRPEVQPNLPSLAPYSHPNFPGFPLTMPDVYRAQMFLRDLGAYERFGVFPNLTYVFLPADHTNGTRPGSPTPRAMVADNDLALGQIVEAVSKSKFWAKTCIFVVEDDPQNGFDHVDSHRTVALVISPYTKRKFVDHTQYNQTGMVKTIELILGLPPMNQLDLSATAMRRCFQAEPDRTPYTCKPNRIPLDEMNPALDKVQGKARYWAEKSLALLLEKEDQADEDTFNRILWHATRGYDTPYPERFAGRDEDD